MSTNAGFEEPGKSSLHHKLTEAAADMPKLAGRAVFAAATVMEQGMKLRCPSGRTGTLGNTIRAKMTQVDEAEVGPHAAYAAYVEFGTGIHSEWEGAPKTRIVPVRAKALAWTQYDGKGLKGGTMMVRKSVAGVKPQPFVRPTYHEDKEKALAMAKHVLDGGLKKAVGGLGG